jgi:hypothetical protein
MSTTLPARKRNSLRPVFAVQLVDAGVPIPLGDVQEVRVRFRRAYTTATAADVAMTIDDAPTGKVSCEWPAAVIGQAGEWEAEFRLIYATGPSPRIIPETKQTRFTIEAEMAEPAA